MKYENEITVETVCSIQELNNLLEKLEFKVMEEYDVFDIYMLDKNYNNTENKLELLKHCILIRDIVGKDEETKKITYKYKEYNEKEEIVKQGKSDCEILDIEEAKNLFLNPSGKCILFIDEIHRFNKLQQDALLPFVENGTIILIGATTENPYFSVNKALISRSMVVKLNPLTYTDIFKILKNALANKEGLGNYKIDVEDSTLEAIAKLSGGDVRTALNTLELAVLTTEMNGDGTIKITQEIAAECMGKKKTMFDKSGDSHYDNISAFIKSMRGSDPDATVFYLARAIDGGEDPVFLARRIVIAASEDVGLANPNALVVATSAMQAAANVGMPEARIILAEAAVYVANSPKSNSTYMGINQALEDVKNKETGEVPMHIRNAPADCMAKEGYGVGYKYPHDYPGHWVEQQYLPDKMLGTKYYIKDDTVD